jgi:RNA polymerase-interacting CarD/CdnL/TRCF family regulator
MSEENQEKQTKKYKVGDKIVRFGRVYEIFKVTEEPVLEGEGTEEIIHFRPVYETVANKSLICSIPAENVEKTNMRQPLSKEEVEELIDFLRETIEMKKRFNTRQAKELLKSNDPDKIAMILKKLAIVKHDPDTNFTYTKKRIFRKAIKRLQEEIALVKDMDLDETEKMLTEILDKQGIASMDKYGPDEEDED